MTPCTFIDAPSGPGGLSLGFWAAGWRSVAGIEHDHATAETYAANHPGVVLLRRDIRHVPVCELEGVAWRQTGRHEVDAVIGGPPCQIHSYSGRGRLDYDPERLFLYRELVRLAAGLRVKVILVENVEGILTKRVAPNSDRLVLDQLRSDLDAAGFVHRREYLLDAWDYGVPQRRRRYFCLASRLPQLRLRPPRPSPVRPTVAEAFADLPEEAGVAEYGPGRSGYSLLMRSHASWPLPPGTGGLTWHDCPPHGDRMVERFRMVPQGKRIYDVWLRCTESERAELRARGVFARKPPHKQTAARLAPWLPSRTVTSHVGVHLLHPTQDRALTAREATRLQSFPDRYEWRGKLTGAFNAATRSVYEQIGSAVPPLLARAWGVVIRQMLEEAEGGVAPAGAGGLSGRLTLLTTSRGKEEFMLFDRPSLSQAVREAVAILGLEARPKDVSRYLEVMHPNVTWTVKSLQTTISTVREDLRRGRGEASVGELLALSKQLKQQGVAPADMLGRVRTVMQYAGQMGGVAQLVACLALLAGLKEEEGNQDVEGVAEDDLDAPLDPPPG